VDLNARNLLVAFELAVVHVAVFEQNDLAIDVPCPIDVRAFIFGLLWGDQRGMVRLPEEEHTVVIRRPTPL